MASAVLANGLGWLRPSVSTQWPLWPIASMASTIMVNHRSDGMGLAVMAKQRVKSRIRECRSVISRDCYGRVPLWRMLSWSMASVGGGVYGMKGMGLAAVVMYCIGDVVAMAPEICSTT